MMNFYIVHITTTQTKVRTISRTQRLLCPSQSIPIPQ